MSALFARQALASLSRTKPSSLRLPLKAAPAAYLAARRRCFSVSLNLLEKRYTESHEWVEVSDDKKSCTIGISQHASQELGEVVFVELPEKGTELESNVELGTVESVKAVGEVLAPVSGTVTEVNEALVQDPELLSDDPEGTGWLVRLEAGDFSAAESLMSPEEYNEHLKAHQD
ncbi:glycine cleavage system H-protein subunit [Neonectria punicea]|uniref:Glycine cleavage system H protein n=1 Tax=Neonectria punicea TaxID=979145 RepID=A0ABR1HU44_9HYPO